jgi:hypothetical protein
MRVATLVAALGLAGVAMATPVSPADSFGNNFIFSMVPTGGAEPCIAKATGRVTITSFDVVENMHVEVRNLPANTDFDLFVIQVPNFPFGMSWYMGDMLTDNNGTAVADFIGRFSEGTFSVAIGTVPAPVVSGHKDAGSNPVTGTSPNFAIQQYHLGLWFDTPADAGKAGCATTETPFNSTQSAGVQILNTSNFPDNAGPLRHVP